MVASNPENGAIPRRDDAQVFDAELIEMPLLLPGWQAEALAQAAEGAANLNPLSEIVVTADRDQAVTAAFAALTGAASTPAPPQIAVRAVHPRVAVRLARPKAALSYDDLAYWLDNLAGALGERLLRLKGLVRITESERPVLVQSVGTVFSPPRPFGEPHAPRWPTGLQRLQPPGDMLGAGIFRLDLDLCVLGQHRVGEGRRQGRSRHDPVRLRR